MCSKTAFVLSFGLVIGVVVVSNGLPLLEEQLLDGPYYEASYIIPSDYFFNDQELRREVRSLQPQNGVYDNGALKTEVSRDSQGNTQVNVGAQGNIYKDKARSVDAEAQWSKVIHGPARAKPQVRGSITYRW